MKWIILCIVSFGLLQAGPQVVAKFGPQECPWSEQLKKEVWSSPSFQALLKSAGIECKQIDVSSYEKELPLFTLYTEEGDEIGSLGFLLITPEKYVDLFKEMISIHMLCNNQKEMPTEQILNLYRKSQLFHMEKCEEKLMQLGLKSDQGVDFLIEYYAKMVKDHPRKAHKIKDAIRQRKPHDTATEWSLALLSFQAKKENCLPESEVVLPLQKFLKEFGATHAEYAWRCHLVLAEYFHDMNRMDEAKYHAQKAREGAPEELQLMITALGNEES